MKLHGHWSVQQGLKVDFYWKDPWYLVLFVLPFVCSISFLFTWHDSVFCHSPVLRKGLFLAFVLSVPVTKCEVSFFIFAGLPICCCLWVCFARFGNVVLRCKRNKVIWKPAPEVRFFLETAYFQRVKTLLRLLNFKFNFEQEGVIFL